MKTKQKLKHNIIKSDSIRLERFKSLNDEVASLKGALKASNEMNQALVYQLNIIRSVVSSIALRVEKAGM